jgi:hypothetical protein
MSPITTDTPAVEKMPEGSPPDIVTLNPPLRATHPKTVVGIFYLSTMACVLIGWIYYYLCILLPWVLLLLPMEIIGIAFVFLLSSLFLVRIAVGILSRKYPPAEGTFERDGPEQRAYEARHFLKYYAIWLTRTAMFPWIDKIAYAVLGVHTGKSVVLHEAWVDTELVTIGDFSMMGMNSTVMSHALYQHRFVARKTTIDGHSIIGAYTVVAPGTHVGKLAVLGANSGTSIGEEIEPGFLYGGNPARKLKHV